MKTLIKILFITVFAVSIDTANAQTINWADLNGYKNLVSANLGFDFGAVYGLAYGHMFRIGPFPCIVNIEYSSPAGKNLFDDFKTEPGIQISWFDLWNFQFSTKINGVFRRYENDFVRLLNFGSDFTGILGYYRRSWFVSCEVGFDKAIVTHFRHSAIYRDINPTAANGWFIPSTGGNFYYGLQTGVSLRKNDINLRIGKILTQDFKTTPITPYYFHLGYNRKF